MSGEKRIVEGDWGGQPVRLALAPGDVRGEPIALASALRTAMVFPTWFQPHPQPQDPVLLDKMDTDHLVGWLRNVPGLRITSIEPPQDVPAYAPAPPGAVN